MRSTFNISLFLFVFLSGLYSTSSHAGFHEALEAYKKKDYQTAYKEFESLAEIGEVRSQLNLAVMYFYGQGVQQNINKAYAWARIGTENDVDNLSAKNKLSAIENQLTDKDYALKVYKKLAKKYSYDALLKSLYPSILDPVADKEKDRATIIPIYIKAGKYPKKALKKGITGWVTVQFNLDPYGYPRDVKVIQAQPKKIFVRSSLSAINKWRFKPVLDKSARAVWQHDVRYTMEYKLKGAPSFNHQYFNRAYAQAKSGNPIAQAKYGFLKQNIRDYVYLDNHSYSYWYLKAAIQGVPFAQFAVGENLIYGQGNRLDKSKGVQWLTRAASNGVVEASELLAKISIKNPSEQAQEKAVYFFNHAKKTAPSTRVQFARLFATSPYSKIRDPDKAISLIEDLSWSQYRDDITKQEILALAYAAKGDYKKAIKYQQGALEDAEDDGFYSIDIKNHLKQYQQQKNDF